MAKQISTPVPFPAPVTGVQDPAVRRALQDLIDAHQTRNGQTKERFLTEADIKQLAGMIVYTGLSGSGAGGGDGGGGDDFFDGIRQTIEDRIFSTKLFKKLSSEIEWLTTANSLSLAKISSLENGFNESRIEVLDGNAILVQETKGLKAGIGSNTAAILEERTVRATNDSALVSAINTMFAAVGTNNALIQDGNNLAVNWNAAQAEQWTQIQVEVFGADGQAIRAALAEEAQLRVDLEGNIENTWTVRMNADGRWAGFGLGMEGTPGSVVSTFIVAADQFAVVSPGQPGGTPQIPFYIGPTNGLMLSAGLEWGQVVDSVGRPENSATVGARIGTNLTKATGGVAVSDDFLATWNKMTEANIATFMETAVIGTAYIGDAAIVSAKIGNAEVGTLKVAGDAVTSVSYNFGTGSTAVTLSAGDDGMFYVASGSGVNNTAGNATVTVGGGGGSSAVNIGPFSNATIAYGGYIPPGGSVSISCGVSVGTGECTIMAMGRMR